MSLSFSNTNQFLIQPANLTREHFLLGEKTTGEYKGRETLKLLNHSQEKAKKLTLGDYLCRKDEGQFDMIEFPEDEFSIVKLFKHIEENFMPPKDSKYKVEGCFFRRMASAKALKVRFSLLIFFCFERHSHN